jgi:hypothetical protein
MATTVPSRSRQNAAQIHALAGVEPEVRACDQSWRRKYLQDYAEAFRTYESVLGSSEFEVRIASADAILVGDYHALPSCQQFVAKLVKDRAQVKDRPVVLAVETIFSRDQHILDEWWRREIHEPELRQRIRFDLDWGYDWDPFYKLLTSARKHADAAYGLDCMPREDLRKISARDRHAAHKIGEIRERHPDAVIVALIGESHLAPAHLPALVHEQLKGENVLTILQNVDALYWRANGEQPQGQAVRVNGSTVCVFNSTPIEKYESYRSCLNRWSTEPRDALDFAPAFYGLIDVLLRFLDINRYAPQNGTQPRFLVDLLPEVWIPSTQQLRKMLSRYGFGANEIRTVSRQLKDRGCLYLPRANAMVVRNFKVEYAAEEAARFLHHACQGLPFKLAGAFHTESDRSWAETLECALAYLGSQILCRDRRSDQSLDKSGVPQENNGDGRSTCRRKLARDGVRGDTVSSAGREGRLLGAGLYDTYVRGALSRADLRRLFLFPVQNPEKARELCAHLNRRLHLAE